MTDPRPLTAAELASALEELPGWSECDGALVASIRLRGFSEVVALLSRVAVVADEQQHHPDALCRYGRLTLALRTHDAGGAITARDVTLAQAIELLRAATPSADYE